MTDKLFRLPEPLPEGAVFVGPAAWPADTRQATDPSATLDRLRGELADEGADAAARLVVVHQDAFAGAAGADLLERWLEDLSGLRGPYLPVLLHASLPGNTLVRFFRAGLFDAISVPAARTDWVNMLIRAERRLELRQQSRLILASSGRTQDVLRSLRRELGQQATGAAGELLQAQESLEAANRQLTDAMAELSLLYRFGRELGTARNWDDVLREILRNLTEFVGAGGAALVLRSAPGGSFSPRQTWQWDDCRWDRVLVSLQEQVDGAVAESIMAPGVFRLASDPVEAGDGPRRIIAQPLEHQDLCLGYLLLLFATPARRDAASARFLPFLQAVQVVLAEEVAGAQLLDRIRDIGKFNSRVLETVSSAIWVVDEEGRTVYVNRAGQVLLTGREGSAGPQEDFLYQVGRGRQLPPLAAAEGLPELLLDGRLRLEGVEGPVLAFLRDDPVGHRGEGQVVAAGDQRIPVLVQTSRMAGRARDESWLVIVAEDLRETRILQAERQRAERLEGLVEMSATLAHEIRNPLMGLSAQAELLADQLPSDDPRGRYLDVITREVGRIDGTITRMLNFVRPYEPDWGTADLGELVADVIDLAAPRAGERRVHLAATAPTAADWRLDGDAGQLKQVLLNLVLNGLDAAGADGRVELRLASPAGLEFTDPDRGTRRVAPGLVCEVRDTGPGIAPDDRGRIFRPFFTTKSSGTGLGLSICNKIVAAHGGEITVDRDGNETVFRVVLPRQARAAQRNHQEEA